MDSWSDSRHSRITEQCFSWLDQWGDSRLHIEDPFLLERNLNCVLGSWQEGTSCLRLQVFCAIVVVSKQAVWCCIQLILSCL